MFRRGPMGRGEALWRCRRYDRAMFILENGTKLPPIMGVKHDGEAGDMVASVAGKWAAVLLYRGDW